MYGKRRFALKAFETHRLQAFGLETFEAGDVGESVACAAVGGDGL